MSREEEEDSKLPSKLRRKANADHGENFVPGSETAPNLAPQPLDHFKRGYRERAHLRDRETTMLNGDFRRRSSDMSRRSSSGVGDRDFDQGRPFQDDHSGSGGGGGRRFSSSYDRRGSGIDRGEDHGGRGQVIMGLDVQALVERLCRPGYDVFAELDATREEHLAIFQSGKAVTAIISNLARRRKIKIALAVWDWIDSVGIKKNTFHYNSMISVCEKVRDYTKALRLLDEMREKNIAKNEVTFSSAISACEKCGQWRTALDLLEQMKREGAGQTAIAYNAAISACEKGLVPHKALEIFEQMKREGVKPTVVTYSALISAAEKGQQWKLALEVLEEMKAAGHGANVIAYSAAISALSKGQMWFKALELFREIEASGGKPSIVTYNATMTALEKGLQWERALDLFDEMKLKNMPVTVVSYGSAISACEKGLQYRQCLEFLDEMTEMGIKKNVIIFGAAMSCMEKSCRADIAFQLMDRMKLEDVAPNVHIYNSAISACARCNLWEKGYELFNEMEQAGVARDVVTYNAVLDAVCSQVELGRKLFREGVERGFYARVSRLGSQWLELDLHFLSLGGGEIALGWWFEECLVPYLVNTSKLEAVQSISIVTGYGKTRARGARLNDDGMRLRVRAMLKYMGIKETPQPNKGRIHINKVELISEVKKNGGKVIFDVAGYQLWKEEETTANKFPDVPQQVRPRFRPARPGEGPPGTFIREGGDPSPTNAQPDDGHRELRRDSQRGDLSNQVRRDSRRSAYDGEERRPSSSLRDGDDWYNDRRGSHLDRHSDRRGSYADSSERRGSYNDHPDRRASYNDHPDRRGSYNDHPDRRGSYNQERRGSYDAPHDRRGSYDGNYDRRGGHQGNYDRRGSHHEGGHERRGGYEAGADRRGSHADPHDRRGSYLDGPDRRRSFRDWELHDGYPDRGRSRDDPRGDRVFEREEFRRDEAPREARRYDDRDQTANRSSFQSQRPSFHGDELRYADETGARRNSSSEQFARIPRDPAYGRERHDGDRHWERDERPFGGHRDVESQGTPTEPYSEFPPPGSSNTTGDSNTFSRQNGGDYSERPVEADHLANTGDLPAAGAHSEDSMQPREGTTSDDNAELNNQDTEDGGSSRKRGFDEFQKQQANRGYSIEPAFSKRRSV